MAGWVSSRSKWRLFKTLLFSVAWTLGKVCSFFFLKLTLLNVLFQELVTKVFQQMWFTPLKNDENSDVLVKRVVHMTDVVSQRVNVNC